LSVSPFSGDTLLKAFLYTAFYKGFFVQEHTRRAPEKGPLRDKKIFISMEKGQPSFSMQEKKGVLL
jgi:hypothetical protein